MNVVGATQGLRRSPKSSMCSYRTLAGFLLLLVLGSFATACNIPVFRYALERWQPDECSITVFVAGRLSAAQVEQLGKLGYSGTLNRVAGALSDSAAIDGESPSEKTLTTESRAKRPQRQIRWVIANTGRLTDEQAQLWADIQTDHSMPMPHVVMQAPTRLGPVTVWQGELREAAVARLVDSPVRRELSDRLLAGHSIVWLVVKGDDAKQNADVVDLLNEQSRLLSRRVALPEGIGLPGSELFSDIPLVVKFSVLEIDAADTGEAFLINLFRGMQPSREEKKQALVVPVFGRGRALEVIPAEALSESLVGDLANFLCAACSCQVKEQNPGFDLLLNVDWQQSLFGDTPPPEDAAAAKPRNASKPTPPLTIPPGRKR